MQPTTETFVWNDHSVIDFVNWYIKLNGLSDRYELENQHIIDSFKNGDEVSAWKSKFDDINPNKKPTSSATLKVEVDFDSWFNKDRMPQNNDEWADFFSTYLFGDSMIIGVDKGEFQDMVGLNSYSVECIKSSIIDNDE